MVVRRCFSQRFHSGATYYESHLSYPPLSQYLEGALRGAPSYFLSDLSDLFKFSLDNAILVMYY